MADDHASIPLAIDTVVSRLSELEIVFGPQAKGVINAVRTTLLEALAARQRGDAPASITKIGQAMDRLAGLAEHLDPAEGVLMRTVAEQFRAALLRYDTAEARQTADVMFERSGAAYKKEK
jgi:hypothetical protein